MTNVRPGVRCRVVTRPAVRRLASLPCGSGRRRHVGIVPANPDHRARRFLVVLGAVAHGRRLRRRVVVRQLGSAVTGTTLPGETAGTAAPQPAPPQQAPPPSVPFAMPPIHHVFVIVLENQGFAASFANPAADPYLATTLPSEGALLTQYYAIGHYSLANYVALVSGQPPNAATSADCPSFSAVQGAGLAPSGVEQGNGCVYPPDVPTIAGQLGAAGLSWKAYLEDMGNDPAREAAACAHPALGASDPTQSAVAGDGYTTRHDPFVYFESVTANVSSCDAHVVALGSPSGAMPPSAAPEETGLPEDLRSAATTPSLSFIVPDLCDDGHDYPCVNEASRQSALRDVDAFLETWVPIVTSSSAFRQDGLLEITFDESAGPTADSSSCCGEYPGPALAEPGIDGPGGGRVGAVLLSPFIRPGTVSAMPYDHYSSLATFERIFGLAPLAEAAAAGTFGADVFTAPWSGRP